MKFPALYGIWWFSRVFTKRLPLVSLMSLTNPVHNLLAVSLISILILSYHLYLCFPTKTMYAFLIFPICFACSTPLILLKIVIFNEQHNLWSSSFCSFFQHPGPSAFTNNKNNTIFNLYCSVLTRKYGSPYGQGSMHFTSVNSSANKHDKIQDWI